MLLFGSEEVQRPGFFRMRRHLLTSFLRRQGEDEVTWEGLPVLEEPLGNDHRVADYKPIGVDRAVGIGKGPPVFPRAGVPLGDEAKGLTLPANGVEVAGSRRSGGFIRQGFTLRPRPTAVHRAATRCLRGGRRIRSLWGRWGRWRRREEGTQGDAGAQSPGKG